MNQRHRANKRVMNTLLTVAGVTALASTSFAAGVTLSQSKKIAETAEAYAASKGWKLSIAIVNDEGNLVYFQRSDDSYSGSIDAAIAKAKSANSFRRPTSAFVQGIKEGRHGLLSVPGIVALEGGVPIEVSGKHLGAVGVSGARSVEDEETALAALKGIKK